MKTILFILNDNVLDQKVCEAYVCLDSRVEETINWRRRYYEREVKEGYISILSIKIIDRINITMLTK